MTKDEALKALIHEMEYVLSCINERKIPFDGDDFHEALRLGKKALAQPEQTNIERHEANVKKFLGAPQPEQEPVAQYIGEAYEGSLVQLYDDVKKGTNFYTTPPQRTWVELTDEEVRKICVNEWGGYEQCRAIEAKLKQKNGYAEEKNT